MAHSTMSMVSMKLQAAFGKQPLDERVYGRTVAATPLTPGVSVAVKIILDRVAAISQWWSTDPVPESLEPVFSVGWRAVPGASLLEWLRQSSMLVATVPAGTCTRTVCDLKPGTRWFLSFQGMVDGSNASLDELKAASGRLREADREGIQALLELWDRWDGTRSGYVSCVHLRDFEQDPLWLRAYGQTQLAKDLRVIDEETLCRAAAPLLRALRVQRYGIWQDLAVRIQRFLEAADDVNLGLVAPPSFADQIVLPWPAPHETVFHGAWVDAWFLTGGMDPEHWEPTRDAPDMVSRREVSYDEHPHGLRGTRCGVCGAAIDGTPHAEPVPDAVVLRQLPELLSGCRVHDLVAWRRKYTKRG